MSFPAGFSYWRIIITFLFSVKFPLASLFLSKSSYRFPYNNPGSHSQKSSRKNIKRPVNAENNSRDAHQKRKKEKGLSQRLVIIKKNRGDGKNKSHVTRGIRKALFTRKKKIRFFYKMARSQAREKMSGKLHKSVTGKKTSEKHLSYKRSVFFFVSKKKINKRKKENCRENLGQKVKQKIKLKRDTRKTVQKKKNAFFSAHIFLNKIDCKRDGRW